MCGTAARQEGGSGGLDWPEEGEDPVGPVLGREARKLGWLGVREKKGRGHDGLGQNRKVGRNLKGSRTILFEFWIKVLSLKSKVLNMFKLNLNWSQTRRNLNKLFEYFSNLELLDIDSNI
jgi:hypothetical protein